MARKILTGGQINSILNEISGVRGREGSAAEATGAIRSSPGRETDLEALLGATRLGTIVTDEYGRIRKWNRSAERLLGSILKTLRGRTVSRLSADPGSFTRFMSSLLECGEAEGRLRLTKEEDTLDLHLAARVLKDLSGPILGTVFILDQKPDERTLSTSNRLSEADSPADLWQLETALRESESAFRDLARDEGCSTVFILQDARFVFANKQAEALFNRTAGDLSGRSFQSCTSRGNTDPEEWISVLETGKGGFYRQEMIMELADDRRVLELIALRTRFRGRTAVLGSMVDITRQKIGMLYQDHILLHDLETDLPNAKFFRMSLARALERCERYERLLGLIHLCFRRGSSSMTESSLFTEKIGGRLKEVLRSPDLICRISWNGFAVLLEELQGRRDVSLVASRMMRELNRSFAEQSQNGNSWSVGLSVYPFDGKSPEELLKTSQNAVCRA
ncbi:MAG: PAS domain S-box protein [Desulfovibrionales bacterium]